MRQDAASALSPSKGRPESSGAASLNSATVLPVLAFSVASSGLLLINKLCLKEANLPSLLALAQFVASVLCSVGLKAAGAADVDELEWPRVRTYIAYIGLFTAAIFANMHALSNSNVETLIVFRACGPLLVSVLEWHTLGRMLPSRRSALALLGIMVCAAGYVASDRAFAMHGIRAYSWCLFYFVAICLSDTVGKHIISGMQWRSMWGPVLYTNLLASPTMIVLGVMSGETSRLATVQWTAHGVGLYLLSCVFGIAISFTGWRCRAAVSATCYTVLGVANKMLTVLVNVLIWDDHASPAGIACLVGCLACATAYRPAPLRRERTPELEMEASSADHTGKPLDSEPHEKTRMLASSPPRR